MVSQIEDARAAMMLYQRHKKEWERNVKDRSRLMEKQKKRKKRKNSSKKVAVEVIIIPVLLNVSAN